MFELNLNIVVITIFMLLTRLIVSAWGNNRARRLNHFTCIEPEITESSTQSGYVAFCEMICGSNSGICPKSLIHEMRGICPERMDCESN